MVPNPSTRTGPIKPRQPVLSDVAERLLQQRAYFRNGLKIAANSPVFFPLIIHLSCHLERQFVPVEITPEKNADIGAVHERSVSSALGR